MIPLRSPWVERITVAVLALALIGLWLAGRDRHEAADTLDRVTQLEADLAQAYKDRLDSCARGNIVRNVLHQFIIEAADARRRTPEPGDLETAKRYEALDALIWPTPVCERVIVPPSSGG